MAILTGFNYRKELTIDNTQINSTQSDFPILVKLDSSNFDFTQAKSDGFDIRFTSSDGSTPLDFERLRHDDSGELGEYIVKIPSVSDSTDTTFFMYWGNPSSSNGEDVENTWASEIAVYHLENSFLDSTSNDNDATNSGTLDVSSEVSRGRDFDDSSDFISTPESGFTNPNNVTVSCLVYLDSTPEKRSVIAKKRTALAPSYGLEILSSGLANFFVFTSSSNFKDRQSTTNLSTGQWYHIVGTWDGTTAKIFVNGIEESGTTAGSGSGNIDYSSSDDLHMGTGAIGAIDGRIDEVSIYGSAVSSDFINSLYKSYFNLLVTFGSVQVLIDENIIINDNNAPQSPINRINESIIVNDNVQSLSTNTEASFASKIISVNPLIFVTDTSPAEIVKVDVSDPVNPTHQVQNLITGTNATDVAYNSVTEFLYVSCANGIIVKVDINNLSTQLVIDLSDTDELTQIEVLSNFGLVYAGTDEVTGEIYLIDERTVTTLDSDFKFLADKVTRLDSKFSFISATTLDSDFKFLSDNTTLLNSVFYFLPQVDEDCLNWDDITVLLDGIALEDNDPNLTSIRIIHPVDDEKSTLSIILARRHDDMNTDLNGNTKTITNQNTIKIVIDGVEEFSGQISNINCTYDKGQDAVEIGAVADKKPPKYNNITLSLPSLDENLDKKHIRIQNPAIDNPVVSETDENPEIFKGIRVDLGDVTKQSILRFSSFQDGETLGNQIIEGEIAGSHPKQNWTYFWFLRAGLLRPDVSVSSETIVNDGGDDLQDGFLPTFGEAFDKALEDFAEEFDKDVADFEDFDFDQYKPEFTDFLTVLSIQRYIGTSLSGLSSDLWDLISASYKYQRIEDDIVDPGIVLDEFDSTGQTSFALTDTPTNGFHSIELVTVNGKPKKKVEYTYSSGSVTIVGGTVDGDKVQIQYGTNDYFVGEAPFQTISVRNGRFIPKEIWRDRDDGFYRTKEDGFNFIEYAKEVANLEYEKLLNINNQIVPRSNCFLSISLDSYYYHSISTLTRINIDNTTKKDIFNNNQGFPLSVKSISIDTSSGTNGFMVDLDCSNQKSNTELEAIDGRFPDENSDDYNFPGYDIKVHTKFDLKHKETIQ